MDSFSVFKHHVEIPVEFLPRGVKYTWVSKN